MNKTILFSILAATLLLASCQKERVIDNPSDEPLVFTAVIDAAATKTTVNTDSTDKANRGKVSWAVGDEISICDGTNTAVYYVKEGGIAADGSATFSFKSGSRLSVFAEGYSATYGTAITTVQTYTASVANLPMTGASDTNNKTKLNFTVSCGLLKLNLTAGATASGDAAVSKVEVFGTTGEPATFNTYTLNCESVQDISSAKDFFLALPAGSYSAMRFTNSTGHICYMTAKTAMSIANNHIQPVTLTGVAFNDMLPGVFTVNEAGKKVRFSRGNLQATYCYKGSGSWTGYEWDFAENQYDYIGGTSATANTTGNNKIGNHNEGDKVDLFGWSSVLVSNMYGISNSENDNDYSGSFKDWGAAVKSQVAWYTPSGAEWNYLLNTRSQTNKFAKAKVQDSKGLLVFPDGYGGTTEGTGIAAVNEASANFPEENIPDAIWISMETAGVLFLSCAYSRTGTTVQSTLVGNYWTSTSNNYTEAYCLVVDGGKVATLSSYRHFGYSVRLAATESFESSDQISMQVKESVDGDSNWQGDGNWQ